MAPRLLMLAGMILSAAFLWAAAPTPRQEKSPRENYNSGAHLYREFCSSCHGESGKGDGPVAETLPRRAADLTLLAQRSGGVFPRNDVLAVVESTNPIPEHAGSAMPNWRDTFYRLERGNERAVRQRIDAIVSHLESLQQKH